ncbi:monocarboxylate transporter 7-like [Palaemon carinicauda]|uniref:monocarboxylate transporter 7-like n=1 Tax=Palaemon carinicauda TaxID=392227 RepID=UPI0035B67441
MSSSQNPSSSNENDRVRTKPVFSPLVPPDGGYGWVIVLGNFIIAFVSNSVMYCFGLFYVYLVQSGYTNTQVAIAPAINIALTNLLAPVTTSLSRYYSHRRLMFFGIALVATGLFMCSLSSNIILFYASYGVVVGLGNSLVAPQGFLASQKYFTHKRVTANSLSMLGGSLGVMTLPLLLNKFIQEYSHRGSFILWSGIILHAFIGAILFHPVQWHMKPNKTIPMTLLTSRDTKPDIDVDGATEDRPERTSLSIDYDDSDEDFQICEEESEFPNQERSIAKRKSRRVSGPSRASGGVSSVIEAFGSSFSVAIPAENLKSQEDRKRSCIKSEDKETADHCFCCGVTIPRLNDIFNFTLFRYPAFVIATVSSVCNRTVYMCFMTYLPSISLEFGLHKDTPYLIMCVTIFELIAKIITSIISHRHFIPRRYFLIFAAIGGSISTFCVTFSWDFWSLAFCCSCYGFFVGIIMCVGPVLLVEYLGMELLPHSYGLLLFMNGITGLVIFGITGLLNDIAGNYITTYWGLSGLSFLPAILWGSINRCASVPNSDQS